MFLGGPVNSRFFENERSPLEEGTKGLGMMTTCDKRGSSGTRRGRDTIRQNSKRENLNLGRTFAPAQLTPTRGAWCTNWPQGKCKVKLQCQLSDIVSTMEHMMEYIIPEEATAHNKHIRHDIEEPLDTPNDEEFTKEEILAVIEKFDSGKAPGEDGLNSEKLLKIFKRFPTFLTGIYNECLRKGYFPKQWKHSIIIPIVKPGKEGSTEVTKYRPIGLLNVGGKALEKLLIDRINHHVFSNSLLNGN